MSNTPNTPGPRNRFYASVAPPMQYPLIGEILNMPVKQTKELCLIILDQECLPAYRCAALDRIMEIVLGLDSTPVVCSALNNVLMSLGQDRNLPTEIAERAFLASQCLIYQEQKAAGAGGPFKPFAGGGPVREEYESVAMWQDLAMRHPSAGLRWLASLPG